MTPRKKTNSSKESKPLDGLGIAFAAGRMPVNAIKGKTMSEIKWKITTNGGAVTGSANKASGCTHLVVTHEQFAKRAPIVVEALDNKALHIVSFEWLKAVFDNLKIVDEDPYLIYNRSAQADEINTNTPSPVVKALTKRPNELVDSDDDKGLSIRAKSSTNKKVKSEPKEDESALDNKQITARATNVPLDLGLQGFPYKVYVSDDAIIYDVTLNLTNSGQNNNKFYRIQVIEKPDGTHWCWTRWGRVGEHGQSKMLGSGDLVSAMSNFHKKFKDKNGNIWDNRYDPVRRGYYAFVERNYEESDDEDQAKSSPKKSKSDEDINTKEEPVVASKLSEPVQRLMQLIFNQAYFTSTFESLNYDAEKMPLGKLSKKTLLRGYEVLKDLANLAGTFSNEIEDKSNQYFSLIPHAFGRNRPPILNNMSQIKREIEVLEALTDMQLATDIMKQAKKSSDVNVLDQQFDGLNLQEMTALDSKSTEYRELETYLVKSGGHTHNLAYKVQDIFRIERQGETERFNESKFATLPNKNRRLLWHGSRCTNFGGILSQGLRIAPPEAPVNGYMFGKGIYLADMSSKSANYCCSYSSGGIGLLLLCEAELGDPPLKLADADYDAEQRAKQSGLISTWGVGQTAPPKWKDAGSIHKNLSGVLVPDVASQAPSQTTDAAAFLQYNEFICYDVAQVKLRYLLRVNIGP